MNPLESNAAVIIKNWMQSNIESPGYDRFNDLHIDRIAERWKSRNLWVRGAFKAFQIAAETRNQIAENFTVVLAFALVAGNTPRGLDFQNLKEMEMQLSSSPPSLYFFPKGREPWTDTGLRDRKLQEDTIVLKKLDCHLLGFPVEVGSCLYMEFRQFEFDEYSRTVFLAA